MAPSLVSDQLFLQGFETPVVECRVPWKGLSPRVLTRSYERFTLKAQAEKSVSDFVDPEQYDLFDTRHNRGLRVYSGAPSLLPLPRRR